MGRCSAVNGVANSIELDLGLYTSPECLLMSANLYSSAYGRFLAVDKLWEKYRSLQPYQYAGNSPVMAVDRNGKWIQAVTDAAQSAVRNSVPAKYRDAIVFDAEGRLSAKGLVEAAIGQDPESNVARLAELATHDDGVEVMVLDHDEVVDVVQFADGKEKVRGFSFAVASQGLDPSGNKMVVGTTMPGLFLSDGITDKSANTPFSMNENTKVYINTQSDNTGKTAAHEFVHVQLLFRHVANPASTNWRHPDPVVDAKTEKAESELKE